jgi:vitamin K-dependent gamma-carboxylase
VTEISGTLGDATTTSTTAREFSSGSRLHRVRRAAELPVNAASVAVFRIAFGVLMVVNTLLYLPVLAHQYYVDTTFNFPYEPLNFVSPLPAIGIYAVYVGMGVTGVLIALGKWYRPATVAMFVLTTYIFLLDTTFFQNHEYLISLLSFLMIFLPLDRRWSLDARRHPDRASATVPAWVLWLLRFQIGIPYFYGGIAKLNGDWFRGEPLRAWLAARTDLEPFDTILTTEAVVWFMTYGALVLDLTIVWFLLHRTTRLPAFVIVTCFHLINVWLFGLFVFPWLMIAATTLFFEPDWPERVLTRLRRRAGVDAPLERPPDRAARRLAPVVAVSLVLWATVQVVAPLRHYAIEGDPSWTEEAHRFSWHMKLRDKRGTVTYVVTSNGQSWRVDPADHLSPKQVARLAGHPDRVVQFAKHLSKANDHAEVHAETMVSLNGRPPQPIIDPTVDLASVRLLRWGHAPWILPLAEPLPG